MLQAQARFIGSATLQYNFGDQVSGLIPLLRGEWRFGTACLE